MTDAELRAIAERLERGPTTSGVSLSPWADQLVKDAYVLLREVERVRAIVAVLDRVSA